MLLFTTAFVHCFLLIQASQDRKVKTYLRVTNGGRWGDWGQTQYCAMGTYAIGYDMKIESYRGTGTDDTSLNSVKLICADVDGHRTGGTVTSASGGWGNWVGETICKRHGSPYFLTSFSLQVESYQHSGDDTAANFMKIKCRDYEGGNSVETVTSPGHGKFGNWGSWSGSCPTYSAVCGILTRVEGYRGHHDDTALNDIMLYCCTEGRVASDPFGK